MNETYIFQYQEVPKVGHLDAKEYQLQRTNPEWNSWSPFSYDTAQDVLTLLSRNSRRSSSITSVIPDGRMTESMGRICLVMMAPQSPYDSHM